MRSTMALMGCVLSEVSWGSVPGCRRSSGRRGLVFEDRDRAVEGPSGGAELLEDVNGVLDGFGPHDRGADALVGLDQAIRNEHLLRLADRVQTGNLVVLLELANGRKARPDRELLRFDSLAEIRVDLAVEGSGRHAANVRPATPENKRLIVNLLT